MKMKKIMIITCASFTAVMLLFTLLSVWDMAPEVSGGVTVQVFVIALSISVLMYIAEKIEDRFEITSLWADTLIRLVICYATVFVEGGLFRMFPYSWDIFLKVTLVLIPVFIITYAIGYFTCLEWAQAINKSIRQRK